MRAGMAPIPFFYLVSAGVLAFVDLDAAEAAVAPTLVRRQFAAFLGADLSRSGAEEKRCGVGSGVISENESDCVVADDVAVVMPPATES